MTTTDVISEQTDLSPIARQARWEVIKTVTNSKAGHIGGPLSMMDLLVSLYFRELNIRPEDPDWEDRDRFILSKGHAAIGLYAVLALRGYLPLEELATFDKGDSRLQGHPDVTRCPGVDASTGSLGQGLSVGVGMALGARLNGRGFHTWVMLGDGEIQEGMVWEAVQVASRYKLSNLTAIVDRNGLQQFGLPSSTETTPTDRGDRRDPWFGVDLAAVFQAFGWRVLEIDGHDYGQIAHAYQLAHAGDVSRRPTVILAHTVKGKGLSLAEGVHTWHSIVPSPEDFERARQELEPDEIELLDQHDPDRGSSQADDNPPAPADTDEATATEAAARETTSGGVA
ncbi:transketolase [Terrabacter terrigena]|uniref:Transketolase n=1 Tax=Terrabacter terrigena TaxID=574718 RepID=A0ABW3N1Z8_9MICO